jgi:hypothetical protein
LKFKKRINNGRRRRRKRGRRGREGEVVGALRQQKWRRDIGCHDNDAKDIFLKPFNISFTLFGKAYKISKNSA